MEEPPTMQNDPKLIEKLFFEVSDSYFQEQEGYRCRSEQGIFSFAAVIWLGILQRLSGNSLQKAIISLVEQLKVGEPPLVLRQQSTKKVREGELSLNTGGISRARARLSEESVHELFQVATSNMRDKITPRKQERRVYVMDGQVVAISRTDSNLKGFCPTGNGEGELHFPRVRTVAAHNLFSGVAESLSVGNWKTSESTLGIEVVDKLPKGSLVIIDRFYHKPGFLYETKEKGIDVVVRLKDGAASKLMGECKEECGEKRVEWKAKCHDGRKVTLKGRVIKYKAQVKGFRSSEFHFFTTADDLTLQEVADLYRQRVQVEIFIRQIKQTLDLFFIRAKKASNVMVEILLAYLTFNLLRAVMTDTAQSLKLPVQRMSFTATMSLCGAYALAFARATTKKEISKLTQQFRKHMDQAKVPLRKQERSYPRVIKYPRDKYESKALAQTPISGDDGK